jgi:hypothetical protein
MSNRNRRDFLADVGRAMLLASVGPAVVADLGLAPAFAADGSDRLSFSDREPLVSLMQQTPADKLLPILVTKLQDGTDLRSLVAAAALANARVFGGEDYTGYHAFMALVPSFQMAAEMPADRRALPVLKVLYRSTRRIQQCGGGKNEVLHQVAAAELPKDRPAGEVLREATRKRDMGAAERTFAALAKGPVDDAYNHLQFAIQDAADVHRVVLAWRAWAALDLVGKEQAHTLLRQSVRYCADTEHWWIENGRPPEIRALLPKLLDQHKLLSRAPGTRKAQDAWVERLAQTIYGATSTQAAEAAAAALAEGLSPEDVGEAISLAANWLVLCDPGRRKDEVEPGKPVGSVHGSSIGVHASDAANAWRNIARVTDARNTFATLIVGAYHTAGGSGGQKQPYPLPEHLEKVKAKDADTLLRDAEAAIKEKDQARAAALVHRYGELGHPSRAVFDLLLRYAVSEDGALHAEKYYRTVTEEFAKTRPAFRWRQLVALARVTASAYGYPAAGYAEACRLLKV